MNKQLIELYSNRELLIFIEGKENFIQKANKFFKDKGLKTVNSNKEWENVFDADFYRMCWEHDNGYEYTE